MFPKFEMYFWWETRLQFSQTNMVKTRADIVNLVSDKSFIIQMFFLVSYLQSCKNTRGLDIVSGD